MVQATVRFFAGATTPSGYQNGLSDLYRPDEDWRAYLIRGGPGTGKSTLIQRLYRHFRSQGVEGELFCCSADPHSLDGLRFPHQKVCILDATYPHVVEPRYWGACEQVVPLTSCMDETYLYHRRRDYRETAEEHRRLLSRCRRLLTEASTLISEQKRQQIGCLDVAKLKREAARLAAKEWEPTGGEGREERRWLSAVTPDGVLPLFETVQALCPRIYTIVDEHGAAAALLLNELKERAVAAGHTVTVCRCPLSAEPQTEHLLIPSLGLAFITANTAHAVDFPVFRRLHVSRFTDTELLKERRERLAFCHRAVDELLDGAVATLTEARTVHAHLETLCGSAMDWDRATALGDRLIATLEPLLLPET